MIGTKYTSGMLAAFAESPRLRRVDVKVEPDGREIVFYSCRYADAEVADLDSVRRHAVSDALHTKSNVFISFYGNETSDDPWLRICEPA